jgi:hypothetical protein
MRMADPVVLTAGGIHEGAASGWASRELSRFGSRARATADTRANTKSPGRRCRFREAAEFGGALEYASGTKTGENGGFLQHRKVTQPFL